MEVSCKSPGSNSWEPFRPNSSQPRRKTVRLSYKRQQGTTDGQSLSLGQTGWLTGLNVPLESVFLPSQRWGWAVCWSSWPALVWLHSAACVEEGRGRDLLRLRRVFMHVVVTSDIKNWAGVMPHTRITGCRSPIRCGSPFLQSSSLLQPEREDRKRQMWMRWTATMVAIELIVIIS